MWNIPLWRQEGCSQESGSSWNSGDSQHCPQGHTSSNHVVPRGALLWGYLKAGQFLWVIIVHAGWTFQWRSCLWMAHVMWVTPHPSSVNTEYTHWFIKLNFGRPVSLVCSWCLMWSKKTFVCISPRQSQNTNPSKINLRIPQLMAGISQMHRRT